MYSYLAIWVFKQKSFMSMVMNFAPWVDMMLLIKSLTVSRLAVGVPALPG
jgi:hypothetical protein